MSLNALGVDCRLQHEIIKALDAEKCAADKQCGMYRGHTVNRGYDAHKCRDYTAHQWTSVGNDIHNAHNQADKQGIVGLHPEENHCRRDYDHKYKALGEDSGKVARQQYRDRVQCTLHVCLQALGEHSLYHSVEQAILLEEEEGDERYREGGNQGREGCADNRGEGIVYRIVVHPLLEVLHKRVGQREVCCRQGKGALQILLSVRNGLLNRGQYRREVEVGKLIYLAKYKGNKE